MESSYQRPLNHSAPSLKLWFSKCVTQTSSTDFAWELIINANSQAPFRHIALENLGIEPSSILISSLGDFDIC